MLKVVYNGYHIEFCETEGQVEAFINSIINAHANLRPRMTHNSQIDKSTKLIVYEYSTLYCEVFLVKKEEF